MALTGRMIGLLREGSIGRVVASSLHLRSSMGVPLGPYKPPEKPLHIKEELYWDDGSLYGEPIIDKIAPQISKGEEVVMLAGALSILGFFATLIAWSDPSSKIPYVLKRYPFNNLHAELGGDPFILVPPPSRSSSQKSNH